ncbi:hypothetical protein [Antarcticirhabdus aurantiaca]|uniref:Uncharacterized protein n=1 Tax=Antarcticirhabdus aurantiaca TaxID=2606717 RepID=A0ACD4NP20_9HYPH|nr:hypothetical protein [Antarcticirhabdus aurantiaca]WAJ28370.1 hypothetical protein OXU80_26770 [Jeongeuplla avenae]
MFRQHMYGDPPDMNVAAVAVELGDAKATLARIVPEARAWYARTAAPCGRRISGP